MKKLFISLFCVGMLAACSGGDKNANDSANQDSAQNGAQQATTGETEGIEMNMEPNGDLAPMGDVEYPDSEIVNNPNVTEAK